MSKEKNATNVWDNLIKTTKYICKIDKIYICVTLISTIVTGIFPTISLLLMQKIINLIQLGTKNLSIVFIYIVLYSAVGLIQTIFQGLIGYFNTKFSLKFNLMIKEKLLEKSGNLQLKDYENSETYDMIRRAQYGSEGKLLSYFNMFISIIGSLITMTSYMIILFYFKVWLVLVVLVVPIIKYFIVKNVNVKQFEIIKARTNEERKAWYCDYLVKNGDNYKELKTYRLFDYFINKYKEYINKFNEQDLKIARQSTVYLSIVDVFEQILSALMFAYVVYNGYIGTILIGNVITYTRTIIDVKSYIQKVLETFAGIQKESIFIDQLYNFLNLNNKKEVTDLKKIDEIREIKIEHLYYKYREDGDYVLKDINLAIKKGEFFALIGRNGSGKTTLIKIMMGFYNDYEGSIYINGINLKEIDKSVLLKKIGTLFQDFAKFETTFRENIGYGNLDIMRNDNRINEISNKFNLQHLTINEPKNIDVQLGYWFDGGKQISIGQWQKVALARAFAKEADIYILDEPNAALDAISEYNLSNMYNDLLKNKIGIIIAHRFNNFIRQANNIIVLEEGVIVESGTHEELINSNGVYNKLYNIQVGNYQMEQNILS
ncbi:ABC-type multidrug transport system fused ATPase/permease subunit [Clostridium pascui]|uniref:ABC transporter ATP-binding protein n=1 Tax=Clostridium pascui TaxID=46609 RepID=UPI00195D6475|nr:ABC transporter ATP-binding protein [Clostridium pascui]MBM7870398.1 ABC-type multidrug transport system fused ATPase/permease subunit [Clostridium pascui]